ncbi:hypothetical protein CLFE_008350 [Clostridium felsineum DSM 794]|nr:hypothetical protein CLFE_008350 [Clostridium felsineum DSM 794]
MKGVCREFISRQFMDDNNLLEQKQAKDSLKKYLLDSYNMSVVVVVVEYLGHSGDNYSIDTTVDKISNIISRKFPTTVYLKIIKLIGEVPVIFLVIDEDSNKIISAINESKDENLLNAHMDIEVVDKNGSIVLNERIAD